MNWHPINDNTVFPKGDFLVRSKNGNVAVAAYYANYQAEAELHPSGNIDNEGGYYGYELAFAERPVEWALIPS